MKKIFSLIVLSLSLTASASPSDLLLDVIYGEDNRVDVYESSDSLLKDLSRSTAAMISPDYLRKKGNMIEIGGRTLQEKGICKRERFADQPSVASCSGFLVKDNVLVTAGHCVKTASACASVRWVFDYRMPNARGSILVPESSVYSCKRVIARELDPITKQDYAVIELTRSVTDRRPLPIRKSGRVAVGDPIAVVGHPSGLPTKIADGAKVRSLMSTYFVTNLDTYHGNSGSPVINTRSGEVEGILVRGDNDFVRDETGCQISKVCKENECRGEDVTYIQSIGSL